LFGDNDDDVDDDIDYIQYNSTINNNNNATSIYTSVFNGYVILFRHREVMINTHNILYLGRCDCHTIWFLRESNEISAVSKNNRRIFPTHSYPNLISHGNPNKLQEKKQLTYDLLL